jgi:hypothetical protein
MINKTILKSVEILRGSGVPLPFPVRWMCPFSKGGFQFIACHCVVVPELGPCIPILLCGVFLWEPTM